MWEGERQQADRGLHHALPGPRGPSSEDVTDLSRAVFQGFQLYLKGVFAKNERGYRLNAIKKRF